jgi:hypothetical protein
LASCFRLPAPKNRQVERLDLLGNKSSSPHANSHEKLALLYRGKRAGSIDFISWLEASRMTPYLLDGKRWDF